MIIGEQRVENNYYESSSQQYEVLLKRKLSSENDCQSVNTYSDQLELKNCSASTKMQYLETYHTFQPLQDQIHQDGDQSYINLTVLTPSMIQYDKNAAHHPEHQAFSNASVEQHNPQQEELPSHGSKQTPSTSTKFENRNYIHQQHHQSDNVEDNEDKNLSWLFNFKLDEIANLSPEIKRKRTNTSHHHQQQHHHHHQSESHQNYYNSTTQQQQQHSIHHFDEHANNQRVTKDPCIEDDLNVAENIVISNTPATSTHTPKKPPFTYTELIEYALEDKGELTVSGIYQWISDRFPYYKSNDDRWKNSVRHNLSINPHFRKGNKAKAGAGHLWKISSRESEANFLAWEHKKQRLELFFKMEAANSLKNQNIQRKEINETNVIKHVESLNSPAYDAELNAATASIISLPLDTSSPIITTHADTESPVSAQLYQFQEVLPVTHHHHQTDELRRTAGEILNGVRRNVEVQIMHPNELQSFSILNAEDYLNPISKEEIMQESGLGRRHDEFYLIDSGINVNGEESTEVFEIFHEDFNLNYFGNNNIIA